MRRENEDERGRDSLRSHRCAASPPAARNAGTWLIPSDSPPGCLQSWLPEGRHTGVEYKAMNPKRDDRKLGSFSINTQTGRWADFATGDAGGDLISLYAYLHTCSQIAAARELASILGVCHD